MAWNEPGKGGKRDPQRDPWNGKDPGSEVDAFVNRLKGMFGGGSGGGQGGRAGGDAGGPGFGLLGWVGAVAVVWVAFNSFQLIDERQRGVVLRFGEFERILDPGANLKWPWPIESVTVVATTEVRSHNEEVMVLTRDENIAQVVFNVQYQAPDPRTFLYGSADPEETLKAAAESAVREVAGTNTLDAVLSDRAQLSIAVRERLQRALDDYATGLVVTELNLQDARPPAEVKSAFDDAIRAREDKERATNEARAFASQVVPEARGQAARVRAEAQGYRDAVVARATGEAQRFSLLAEQYRAAPEVTRRRLHLETLQQVLAANQTVIAGSEGNVLYLPVEPGTRRAPTPEELQRSAPAALQGSSAPAADAAAPAPARPARPTQRPTRPEATR